ncbi:M50 family metallopeptidase [Deltaproteobacteria bacterium OttesenSCG-928-M10]|nr:M50 family metallopeptidase [Deltaproteobacteria bacterium OttesenSCG-928-M10]
MKKRREQDLTSSVPEAGPGFFRRLYAKSNLLILAAAALLLGQIPYLGNVLSWQTSFFHEISHGLAALLTGGRILGLEIHFSGSGLCYTAGGARWLISLAGYAGAVFWGLLIYLSAEALPSKYSHLPAVILASVLMGSAVLYARDFQSWTIILIISILYAAAIKFRNRLPLKFFLKLAGLYILLDAGRAPFALLHHQAPNDAASLAAQTGLPVFFWISLWLFTAAGGLVFIWQIEKRPGPVRPPADETQTGITPAKPSGGRAGANQ